MLGVLHHGEDGRVPVGGHGAEVSARLGDGRLDPEHVAGTLVVLDLLEGTDEVLGQRLEGD